MPSSSELERGGSARAGRRRPRVLLAKAGLDGHNIGLREVARSLRDSGVEVIYGGMMVTPAEIVRAAAQEDVDVIGLSSLNGTHMTHVPDTIELARAEGLDARIVLGGIAPDEDVEELERRGLDRFFGPGTTAEEIVSYVHTAAGREGGGS